MKLDKSFKTAFKFAAQFAKRGIVPILENVLIVPKGGTLHLHGHNGQIGGKSFCFAEDAPTEPFLLNAALFGKVLDNCGDNIELILDGNTARIKSGRRKFSAAMESAADYPVPADMTATATECELGPALAFLVPFASKDDNRPQMRGVFLDFPNGVAVATDAHRLATIPIICEGTDMDGVMIPYEAAAALARLNPSTISTDGSKALFSVGGGSVWCSLVDERFPPYQNVIPKGHKTLTAIPADFAADIKAATLAANQSTHLVKLAVFPDRIEISGEDIDLSSEAEVTTECVTKGGEIEIGFSGQFLQDILKAMGDGCKMKLSAPEKPGVFEKGDKFALLMPVMLTGYSPKY